MVMEYWSGWFDVWGEHHHVFHAEGTEKNFSTSIFPLGIFLLSTAHFQQRSASPSFAHTLISFTMASVWFWIAFMKAIQNTSHELSGSGIVQGHFNRHREAWLPRSTTYSLPCIALWLSVHYLLSCVLQTCWLSCQRSWREVSPLICTCSTEEPALASWMERWTLAPTNLRSPVTVGSEKQKMFQMLDECDSLLQTHCFSLQMFSLQITMLHYQKLEITPQNINSWGIYSASTTVISSETSTCMGCITHLMRNYAHLTIDFMIHWVRQSEH